MTTPTQRWLQAAPASLPRLSGAHSTAERLLLLLHYGIDWESSWVARRRETYWSHHLPNRVRLATYIGASDLDHWWAVVSRVWSPNRRVLSNVWSWRHCCVSLRCRCWGCCGHGQRRMSCGSGSSRNPFKRSARRGESHEVVGAVGRGTDCLVVDFAEGRGQRNDDYAIPSGTGDPTRRHGRVGADSVRELIAGCVEAYR